LGDAVEGPVDVDAPMGRAIRGESPHRLLELAFAARPVAAAGVVPGDGDVNEPLEEVALPGRRLAPLVLELLVRLEIRSRTDEFDPLFQPHAGKYPRDPRGASVGRVSTILLVGVDLFFRGKLEALLPGHRLVTSDSVDAPDLVIADIARVEPDDVVDAWPDVPIVGFTNHTDKAGLQRAHTAGFDQVIVKSALVERAPELVAELTGISSERF
jgi:hypothetical protein